MYIDFRSLKTDLTFDLHADNKNKASIYRRWVQRVYSVAATLQLSYAELWDLPEQEFLVLEEISTEIRKKQEEERKKILSQREGK